MDPSRLSGLLPPVGRAVRRAGLQAVDERYPGGLPEMQPTWVAGRDRALDRQPGQRPDPRDRRRRHVGLGEVLLHYPSGERFHGVSRPDLPRAPAVAPAVLLLRARSRRPHSGPIWSSGSTPSRARLRPVGRPERLAGRPVAGTFDTPLGTPLRCPSPDEARTSPVTDRRDRPRRGARDADEVAPPEGAPRAVRPADARLRRSMRLAPRPASRPLVVYSPPDRGDPRRLRRASPTSPSRTSRAERPTRWPRRSRSCRPTWPRSSSSTGTCRSSRPTCSRRCSTAAPGVGRGDRRWSASSPSIRPASDGSSATTTARVERIVEARDATEDELEIDEINAGIYAIDVAWLRRRIADLQPVAGDRRAVPDRARSRSPGPTAGPIATIEVGDDGTLLGINDRAAAGRRDIPAPRADQRPPSPRRRDDARPDDGLGRCRGRRWPPTSSSSRTSSCAAGRRSGRGP